MAETDRSVDGRAVSTAELLGLDAKDGADCDSASLGGLGSSTSRVLMMEGAMKPVSGGADAEWMVTGGICFSCDQIFSSRKFLEEHVCPSASHICSCGTEFAEYDAMRHHSTTHEPGHQVLDHETIRKRRIEKRQEEEEKLKRLQSGEVVWKVPKSVSAPSISSPTKSTLPTAKTSTFVPQNIMQTAVTSQVPAVYPSTTKPLLPNTGQPDREMQNIFAGVGAPTVDLWTLYQPVVVLRTMHSSHKAKPYTCGKCGESFLSKTSLVSHHSSHVTDKVSGCIGCGLLLSSKKVVPRFHVCNSPSTASKFRLITATPLLSNKQTQTTNSSLSPGAQSLHRNSSPQKTGRNHRAHGITSQMLMNSAQQLKNQNVRPYPRINHSPHITSSLQLKSQTSGAAKPQATVFQLPKSPLQIASNKSRCVLPNTPSAQYSLSASAPLSSPMQSSAGLNGFTCRVCHISFDTAHLLQRHKCPKAREFMAKHTRPGRQVVRHHMVSAAANRNLTQMNSVGKLGFQASGNMKRTQLAPGLDKGQSSAPLSVKTGADLEDDCYIIEDVPNKPTEMIYQVTSSVPIIT